ncbi:MAG TPA: copper resistance protein CopC [Candidatus Limnocylindrales bacterium]|nr:copper resistance protein CopC [Candidatus Limnocylindrales bacterium]
MRRLLIAIAVATVASVGLASAVAAHALPQSSSPNAGASLEQPPTQVSIVFGERPDVKLSSINVVDSSGASVTSGPTTAATANVDELVVPLKALPAGVYTVAWRTVSAVDGHSAAGSFAFGVGGATPPPTTGGGGAATTAGPSAVAILVRWLLYLGLIAMLGTVVFGVAVAPSGPFEPQRLLVVAWLIAAAGTIGVVATLLSDAGVDPGSALSTSFGPGILERLAALLVAALAIVGLHARPRHRAAFLVIAGLAAAAGMLADVGSSHAAAGSLPILEVAIQWVHVAAVGAWLGGLGGLLLATRRPPGPDTGAIAKRFSYIGTIGIATVAATGLLRAISEVGSVDALVGTDFGRLVILKSVLFGGLALLGATNHFLNVPAAGRRLRGLRLAGSGEVLIAATVVLVTASLVNLAPPVEAGGTSPGPGASPAASQGPLVVTGSDFGTSVRLSLAIAPGVAGFNTFSATVTDFDTGRPVPATAVNLRFSLPSRPDIGASTLDLQPTSPGNGVLTGTGANLSIAGAWNVTALVVSGTASVEVPLSITTRCPPTPGPTPSVTVNAVPGLPTIYTAALSAGRSVQIYLDPGTSGANELHATFFDASGNELPVQTATMSIGPSTCAQTSLQPRQLEPGHFVADTTLAAGTYIAAVSGPSPNGDQLAAQVQVTVASAVSGSSPGPGGSLGASSPSPS